MELLTKGPDLELSLAGEPPLNTIRFNGFNEKIYIHSRSGTVIIGWIRKIFYKDCRERIEHFNDSNWYGIFPNLVNGKTYDIHLTSGEIIFDSIYQDKTFLVKFDFLQRVISENEIRWLRESD